MSEALEILEFSGIRAFELVVYPCWCRNRAFEERGH